MTASEPDREQLNAALTMPCLRCGIDMPIEAAIPVMFASGLYEVIYRCSECGGRVRCPTRVERAVTGWQPIETAPANRLIEVGTLGGTEFAPLLFGFGRPTRAGSLKKVTSGARCPSIPHIGAMSPAVTGDPAQGRRAA